MWCVLNSVCRWLSTQLDDGRVCRELVAGASRPLVTYKVVTHTSNLRGAGTDAAVYVQLHGLLGDGLRQQLVGGPTDFDRCDIFGGCCRTSAQGISSQWQQHAAFKAVYSNVVVCALVMSASLCAAT
jgi:hypothetical protein